MGTLDSLIRIALALIIVILLLTRVLSGVAAIVLGIIAVIFLVTSLFSFCPLYVPFRISTRKK